MNIFPIRNDDELIRALKRIDELWNSEPDTPEGDELDIWMNLVEAYVLRAHTTMEGLIYMVLPWKIKKETS